ncbi:MAG: cysteine synthase A [Bdellovibrionales bacterium]
MVVASDVTGLVGNTPLVKIKSLCRLTGSDIFLKCENCNPGGSIKDRAALQMILDAVEAKQLRPGMTIVEGTAGNTGIGLALAARALGFKMKAVMPEGQALEKQRMIELYGAELHLVKPVPFKDQNHFYHTARRMAEENPNQYWWANQFENLSNFKAHFTRTGPEILDQMQGKIDWLVSVAGSGGTIGGNSAFLKEKSPTTKVRLIDPMGSGLTSYFKTGEFKSTGSSITEGIGIMRLVANFAKAKVDDAITLPDQDLVTIAYHLRDEDGLLLGSSAALNVAGAVHTAIKFGPGKRIVTFICDLGERSASKLYNPEYLSKSGLTDKNLDVEKLISSYRAE